VEGDDGLTHRDPVAAAKFSSSMKLRKYIESETVKTVEKINGMALSSRRMHNQECNFENHLIIS
jgi:hypothetical protein